MKHKAQKKGLKKKKLLKLKKVLKKVFSKKKTKKTAKKIKKSSKKVSKKVKVAKVKKAPVLVAEKIEVVQVPAYTHMPVLLEEVLEHLDLKNKKHLVDATLGLAGHAKAILERAAKQAQLFAFELDEDNLRHAQKELKEFGERVVYIQSNFGNLLEELKKHKIKGVDAILIDLGLSSPQVDNPSKGFSFLREGPLDMRFGKNQTLTAADVVNTYSEKELARIFYEYGEERFARKIAHNIADRRKSRKFKTTTELANFIEKFLPRKAHIHPATRVFQALRIEVNKELEVLQQVLQQATEFLKKEGRLVIISYHSLEDRIVKQFFRDQALTFINEPGKLTTTQLEPKLKIITKKPLTPTNHELAKNPRSRSAKLRVAQKL